MKKLFGFLVLFLFVSVSAGFAQGFPPGVFKQQPQRLARLKKENPKLYSFEKKLFRFQKEIQKSVEDYKTVKEVYNEGAKKEEKLSQIKQDLRSLIKKQIEIRNNPDYQAEVMLEMLLRQSRRKK